MKAELLLGISLVLAVPGCSSNSRSTDTIITSQELRAIEIAIASPTFQVYLRKHPSHSDSDVMYSVESDLDEERGLDDSSDTSPVTYCSNEYHVDVENMDAIGQANPNDTEFEKESDDDSPTMLVDAARGFAKRDYLFDTPAPVETPCLDGSPPTVFEGAR